MLNVKKLQAIRDKILGVTVNTAKYGDLNSVVYLQQILDAVQSIPSTPSRVRGNLNEKIYLQKIRNAKLGVADGQFGSLSNSIYLQQIINAFNGVASTKYGSLSENSYLDVWYSVAGASDTTPPTVTITSTASIITAAAFTCTFTLSEVATDFVLGDITVGNGTAGAFAGAGISYTAVITPTGTGNVTVNVAAGSFHDAAGNANLAATQFLILYVAPALWIKGSAVATLFQDSALTTPVNADGQVVGGAVDQSGLSHNVLQTGVDSLKPLYKTNIKNSLSAIKFDGTDDRLFSGAIALNQPNTIFIVGQASGTTLNRTFLDGGAAAEHLVRVKGGVPPVWNIYAGTDLDRGTADNNWHIVTVVFNGASSLIRVDGVQQGATGNAGAGNATGVTLGRWGGAGIQNPLDGYEGEVLFFNSLLSDAVKTQIEAYLALKWAIP